MHQTHNQSHKSSVQVLVTKQNCRL